MTSDAHELARMRSWLWTALIGYGLPLEEASGLLLAVGELCNNSIKHAYGGVAGRPIRIAVDASGGDVVIEVEDWGRPFDEARYVPPDLDAVPEGGLGLFLVRTIADELTFDVQRECGTRWRLVKRRQPGWPGAADAAPSIASEATPGTAAGSSRTTVEREPVMDIEVMQLGQATVVAPKGDLDMAVADQMKRALTELIDTRQSRLVLDLGNVGYIDSSGLGALVASMKHARGMGGDIKICALQSDVRAIFEMTRLIKVMEAYGTRPEAVAAWG